MELILSRALRPFRRRFASLLPSGLRQTGAMKALTVGQQALLVECTDADEAAAAYRFLRGRGAELGASEIVPAARTVLLDGLPDQQAAAALIAEWETPGKEAELASGARVEVELPTRYDGPDLDEVARQWDCSTAEVVRRHQAAVFEVRFCGFAPGFAYCTGLGPDLGVARRADPRPSVPAGSVALAGEYTGVYPTSSPGGWQLIGTTSARLWFPDSERPALLVPGTLVRFVDE